MLGSIEDLAEFPVMLVSAESVVVVVDVVLGHDEQAARADVQSVVAQHRYDLVVVLQIGAKIH